MPGVPNTREALTGAYAAVLADLEKKQRETTETMQMAVDAGDICKAQSESRKKKAFDSTIATLESLQNFHVPPLHPVSHNASHSTQSRLSRDPVSRKRAHSAVDTDYEPSAGVDANAGAVAGPSASVQQSRRRQTTSYVELRHSSTPAAEEEGTQLSSAYPTIVRGNDHRYIELRCHVCGKNTGQNSADFLSGPRAFVTHCRKSHGISLTIATVLTNCKYATLTDDQVMSLRTGREPIYKVPRILERSRHNPRARPWQPLSPTVPPLSSSTSISSSDKLIIDASSISTAYPTIIRDPAGGRDYVELRCFSCGTNVSMSTGEFLTGTVGFARHLALAHREYALNVRDNARDMLQRCIFRRLTAEESSRIRSGKRDYRVEKIAKMLNGQRMSFGDGSVDVRGDTGVSVKTERDG